MARGDDPWRFALASVGVGAQAIIAPRGSVGKSIEDR
jgi:hypothetical protein